MSKVITFSKTFPKYHPKSGQPTGFVKSILRQQGVLINESYKSLLLKLNTKNLFSGKLSYADIILFFEDLKKEDEPFYDKIHTIRGGSRFKKDEKFSPRVWSAKPYNSSQIIFFDDIKIKSEWDFKIITEDDDGENDWSFVEFLGKQYTAYGYGGYDDKKMVEIAKNDGLEIKDFYDWFLTGRTKNQRINNEPKIFDGQIICWGDVSYGI